MTETYKEYYEVRTANDRYGMWGVFETEEAALEEINRCSKKAIEELTYDGIDKFIIVCNREFELHDENGNFLKSEHSRFVTSYVQYSIYEEAFVFAY